MKTFGKTIILVLILCIFSFSGFSQEEYPDDPDNWFEPMIFVDLESLLEFLSDDFQISFVFPPKMNDFLINMRMCNNIIKNEEDRKSDSDITLDDLLEIVLKPYRYKAEIEKGIYVIKEKPQIESKSYFVPPEIDFSDFSFQCKMLLSENDTLITNDEANLVFIKTDYKTIDFINKFFEDVQKGVKLKEERTKEAAYNRAKSGTDEDCEYYLDDYPEGKYVQEVQKLQLQKEVKAEKREFEKAKK